MPYATYVDRSVLSKSCYIPAANMTNLPNKDQNEDKLAIYLPRELVNRFQAEATSEAISLSSTVVELLEKHLAPARLSDQSFESGGKGNTSTAASSTRTSMYDAEDESCEVMTSFLERK